MTELMALGSGQFHHAAMWHILLLHSLRWHRRDANQERPDGWTGDEETFPFAPVRPHGQNHVQKEHAEKGPIERVHAQKVHVESEHIEKVPWPSVPWMRHAGMGHVEMLRAAKAHWMLPNEVLRDLMEHAEASFSE